MPDQPNVPPSSAASAPSGPVAPKPESPAPAAPQPPKAPAGFVNVEIDGRPLQVKAGTNLIEAANQLDIRIPFYCYHKKLTIAANCRMCLVKVSNAPKLVPGCQTPVTEGLKVTTNSPEVMDSHRAVEELLLYNHPVDCAICDQAGECKLQDYYMQYDHRPQRPAQPKLLRHKRKELGPTIVLDQERCVLCTRCVRFMKEIPGEPQLGVFGRGNHEYIDIFPGQELTSRYAGNTVDICPVGALLSRDFRFKARAFYLSQAVSVCAGCSRGCNTFLDHYDQVSYRYRPRENDAVNSAWMCDDGRLTYHRLVEKRALAPMLGRVGAGKPAAFAEAVATAAKRLEPFRGKAELAVLVSPQLSVEDLLAVAQLAKEALGASALYEGGLADGVEDALLLRADKNPNRQGLRLVAKAFGLELRPFQELVDAAEAGKLKALYVAGAEVPIDEHMAAAVLEPIEVIVTQAVHLDGLAGGSDVLLPASPHAEDDGSFVNFEGRLQRFERAYAPWGESRPHWALATELARALGFTWRRASARAVWDELRDRIPEFAQVDWSDLGPNAIRRPGIGLAPAAADARPPGYRERPVQLKARPPEPIQ